MATVRLKDTRIRGDEEYAAGDLYECSNEEALALIANGFAEKVKGRSTEAAVVEAPEKAVAPKPQARKAAK